MHRNPWALKSEQIKYCWKSDIQASTDLLTSMWLVQLMEVFVLHASPAMFPTSLWPEDLQLWEWKLVYDFYDLSKSLNLKKPPHTLPAQLPKDDQQDGPCHDFAGAQGC